MTLTGRLFAVLAGAVLAGAIATGWGILGVADQRSSHRPGYERSCSKDDGCVFGPAWSDDVDVPGGHNGCDTRSDRIRESLNDVQLIPGTHGCKAASGVLHDPYSGQQINYRHDQRPTPVQVDHVVPLRVAWDRGAVEWTPQQRRNFANDPGNLFVTSSKINRDKSDKTPGQWWPPLAGRCAYSETYTTVSERYGLRVTLRERVSLAVLGLGC